MLAYVENDSFNNWLHKINNWIIELKPPWSDVEKLKMISNEEKLAYLNSVTIRRTSELKLHHFWIDITEVKR